MDTDRELVLYVAWARDVAGLSLPRLAKLLDDDDFPRSQFGTLKRIERCLADGRRVYGAEGVLPWCAYARGRVPTRWQDDRAFIASVRRWQVQAIDCPAEDAQPGDRLAEVAVALREALPPARVGARLTTLRTIHLKGQVRDLGLLHAHGIEPWRPR
jgi:hypothetical protein